MGKADTAIALYNSALNLSRAAFAARHYAVAYHALAAAMHAGYDLDDGDRLSAVSQLAQEQEMWLDDHDPTNELSAQSAVARGSRSLWTTLAEDAGRRRQMIEWGRRLRHVQPEASEASE